MQYHPFEPILFKDTRILILGSFPSIKSFEESFYYAHPSNQFWKIMSAVCNYPINNRDQKIWLLKSNHIGLWDMVRSCVRDNLLDSSLSDIEVNDIASLLEEYDSIECIAFTGRKAQMLYKMHFDYLDIKTIYLPSPSSAYAKMTLEQKIQAYKDAFKECKWQSGL